MQRVLAVAATVAATLTVTAGVAAAGDMEVVPDTIAIEGESEFEITLTGFEPSVTVFVLPCAVPDGELDEVDDVDATTCRTNEIVAGVTDDDGEATLTATWEVPALGLAVVAGNEDRTDGAVAIVEVEETLVLGNTQESDDDTNDDTTDDDTAALADTGSETGVLLLVSFGLIAAGGASLALARRRSLV